MSTEHWLDHYTLLFRKGMHHEMVAGLGGTCWCTGRKFPDDPDCRCKMQTLIVRQFFTEERIEELQVEIDKMKAQAFTAINSIGGFSPIPASKGEGRNDG